MNLFATLLMCLLGAAHVTSAAAKKDILPINSRISQARLRELQRRVAGCNANVCFAIDGSDSISAEAFQEQFLFLKDFVAVAGSSSALELAAVQYGNTSSVISHLTFNPQDFVIAISGVSQIGGRSAMTRGINFCIRELRKRRGEANKIVVLGDGRSDRIARAVRRTNRFRRIGGDVCAVGVSSGADDEKLLALAGGDPAKVFQAVDFLDVLDFYEILSRFALEVCGESEPVARDLN